MERAESPLGGPASAGQLAGRMASLVRFRSYVTPAAWGVVASGVVAVLSAFPRLPQVVYLPASLLMLAGSLALLVSGLIGLGRTALAGTALTAAGWLLFAVATVIEAFGNDAAGGVVYSLGTLVVLAGLLVTGVAAILARKWGRWQRLTPLAMFAIFWVVVGFGVLSSAKGASFLGWWGISWIAFGAAMLKPGTSERRRG